jgi:MYXO-CTERM domain-containing protein
MKFVATVCIVLAVATGGYALHPPVESNQQNQSSAGGTTTTTTVSITSITPVDTAPEPSTVTLALLGLGGGAFYLRRRSR